MSTGNVTTQLLTKTVTIDTNLAGKTYHFVAFDATDENVVNISTDATVFPFVLLDDGDGTTAPTRGSIAMGGITKIKLGGSVVAGDSITAGAGGAGVKAATDKDKAGAIAMEGGVSGDIITALIAPHVLSV